MAPAAQTQGKSPPKDPSAHPEDPNRLNEQFADLDTMQTFLGLISLQTGAEIITIALLINKATGLYGLLAILTGFALDVVQLSMYMYSVAILATLAFLLPHIRRRSPFQNLLLSWLYIVDTALSTAFTTYFAAEWYIASAAGNPAAADDVAAQAADTAASMVMIVVFTLVRLYLMLVVMSWTRSVMLGYAASLAGDKGAAKPFVVGTPEGEGWKGKLGRAMLFVGQEYWIGGEEKEAWTAGQVARGQPLAAAVDEEDE